MEWVVVRAYPFILTWMTSHAPSPCVALPTDSDEDEVLEQCVTTGHPLQFSPAALRSGVPVPWQLGEPCRPLIPPSKLDVSWAAELDDEVHVPGKSSQCSLKVTLAWCEGLPRIVIPQASLEVSACMISYGSCSFLSIFPKGACTGRYMRR